MHLRSVLPRRPARRATVGALVLLASVAGAPRPSAAEDGGARKMVGRVRIVEVPGCRAAGANGVVRADISTGTGAVGAFDPLWLVSAAPGGNVPANAFATATNGNWVAPAGNHHWIQPEASPTPANAVAGSFTYRLQFVLPQNLTGAQLSFLFAADNCATVRLNNGAIGATDACPNGFKHKKAVHYVGPLLHPGANVLEIDVTNVSGLTGLLVDGEVRGFCPCPDLTQSVSTGMGAGALTPVGRPDDEWKVIADAVTATTEPRPAVVVDATTGGNWSAPLPGSQWVSVTPAKGAPLPREATTATYQYCVCLQAGVHHPQLVLDLRADDEIVSVTLNGNVLGTGPAGGFQGAPMHVATNTPAHFRAGTNCLEVVVRDTRGVVTGLNVAGTLAAGAGVCCRPDGAPVDLTGPKNPIGGD